MDKSKKNEKIFNYYIFSIIFICINIFYVDVSNAGVFRDRHRFNEDAGEFWMKGRCVVPKNGLGLQDDSRVFRDLGCIVKNRKGKRRPKKEDANVIIKSLYFGFKNDGRREQWTVIEGNKAECLNAERCNTKEFRFPITEREGVRVIGALNCIIGWKRDRANAHHFLVPVGSLPSLDTVLYSGIIYGSKFAEFQDACQ